MNSLVTVNYMDFDPLSLTFPKLEHNERTKGQSLGYPRYKTDKGECHVEIQLPWITITERGVPSENSEYHPTEESRKVLMLPLDTTDPEVKIFGEKLQEIDKIVNSPKMKEHLFGFGRTDFYNYKTPLFRISAPYMPKPGKKPPEKEKLPYIKLKLDLTHPDGKIKSKVYEYDESNGKKTKIYRETPTINEFASFVRWRSKVRAIIRPFKIWSNQKNKYCIE